MSERVDFLKHFFEWCGPSECPTEYLKWSAISLVAASMGNRTFVRMRIGAQDIAVYPNLYTILVGPSANYKSFAIGRALALLGTMEHPIVECFPTMMNLFTGRITAQAMYDSMKTRVVKNQVDGTREHIEIPHRGQFFLVTDELANGVGLGERATSLIVSLTEMYLGGPFDDRTRINGLVHLENYSVNWLAATTPEWLMLALNRDTVLGGFLGRVIVVVAPASKKRIFSTERPHNWTLLHDILVARLTEIFELQGAAIKTPEAARIEEAWYMSREDMRDDDPTMSNWRRQQALSLKLAWILTVMNGEEPYITGDRMEQGQLLAEHASKMLHSVMPTITTNNKDATNLLRWVEKKGNCTRTELNRKAFSSYGMRKDELDRWTTTWEHAGVVLADHQPPSKGGTTYTFKGKRSR